MSNLPKRTKSQKIGKSAAEFFNAVFSEFCLVNPVPQENDLGIDFVCEIMHEKYPTGKLFNVQCKGTDQISFNKDKFSTLIKVTTINYWLINPNPTFIIIVDRPRCIFYWSFPKDYLDSLKKNWQQNDSVSISISSKNCIERNISKLPLDFRNIVYREAPIRPVNGVNVNTTTSKFNYSATSRSTTNILHLMYYYLEGSRIANVKNTYGTPGQIIKVSAQTRGGIGYNKSIEARVWGRLDDKNTIVLQFPVERNYVLSESTFQEVCFLLCRDFQDCEIIDAHTSYGGYPGDDIWINKIAAKAKAWYEIPPGNIKLFKINGKWYAISLDAQKTTSIIKEEFRSGSYLKYDPRRDIVWHHFDLFHPNYSLPLKYQDTF